MLLGFVYSGEALVMFEMRDKECDIKGNMKSLNLFATE